MTTVTKAGRPDWITSYLLFLKGLKSPSETQQLLILLAGKKDRTQKEQRTLDALVKSERAAEKAKMARSAVSSLLTSAKKEEAAEARRARTHGLIQLGLLFDYAGLLHLSRAEILGLLIAGARTTPEQIEEWSASGAAMLAIKEPVKAATTAATPDTGY